MIFDLPQTVEVNGTVYRIRTDFRDILELCTAMNDPELSDSERGEVALTIFYLDFAEMPSQDYQEAVAALFGFLNCGAEQETQQKSPKLVDWEQDFPYIIAPVNRVLGKEARAEKYLHWWTFVAAYREIGGDCTFAQIVHIRDAKARGKAMDKSDREWYRRNRDIVDFKVHYTDEEQALLTEWSGA